jgi:hypothetical protein
MWVVSHVAACAITILASRVIEISGLLVNDAAVAASGPAAEMFS